MLGYDAAGSLPSRAEMHCGYPLAGIVTKTLPSSLYGLVALDPGWTPRLVNPGLMWSGYGRLAACRPFGGALERADEEQVL